MKPAPRTHLDGREPAAPPLWRFVLAIVCVLTLGGGAFSACLSRAEAIDARNAEARAAYVAEYERELRAVCLSDGGRATRVGNLIHCKAPTSCAWWREIAP